jgi:cation transport ATPase
VKRVILLTGDRAAAAQGLAEELGVDEVHGGLLPEDKRDIVDLAQRARRLVRQNLVLAFSFIVVLVALDLAGRLPLPVGVAAHEGSTVLVALNGLRLLRRRQRVGTGGSARA